MIFANPPLVELIAELRWGAQPAVSPSGGAEYGAPNISMPLTITSRVEEWFMEFGAKISADGYSRFERLVPPGFPLMPFQPVYRYRKSTPEDGTSLYQLGPGLFTTNITPPYRSWKQFEPIVENGVQKLLQSRSDAENSIPFGSVLLRYIDAFGPEFTQGDSAVDFLINKLGFKLTLPNSIQKASPPSSEIKASLNFGVPLHNDYFMNIAVGEGFSNQNPSVIMDTTVAKTLPVECSLETVMKTFNEERSIIHDIFIEITRPLEKIMQPVDEV